MSTLLTKLLGVKRSSGNNGAIGCTTDNLQNGNDYLLKRNNDNHNNRNNGITVVNNATANDRNQFQFGADCVRILLFRECEWRGRKLLFDSVSVERSKLYNDMISEKNNNYKVELIEKTVVKKGLNNGMREKFLSENDSLGFDQGKLLCDDISLLGEMIFGSVAMTYRGSSFKIHAMTSPDCIMCTKIFPYSEHSVCRRSVRCSNETIGTWENSESSSNSNSSIRTQSSSSQCGSGNFSNNSLSPSLRKNSMCSSTGSGWDIDVPGLENSNGSSGSLTSLRRRWQRVMTTSLSQSESEDSFCQSSEHSSFDSTELVSRKHKTRLGLAMLVQLPGGYERETTVRLMEHAAVLEGMLDRLRHVCIDSNGNRSLIHRLYKAKGCCNLRLLVHLLKPEKHQTQASSLMWHDLLLNASMPAEVQVTSLHRSLQQMCRLLDELDTKSTNFFLSTIVTAVLTHHLGWVHTAPPQRNRQLMENLSQQYPCNPLWAQLSDLYGALGTPVRVSHTVIAGDSDKMALIEATLNFLSYFLRSGLVQKREETRCSAQEDVQEACAILERHFRNNPTLQQKSLRPTASSSKRVPLRRTKPKEDVVDTSAHSLQKSKSHEEIFKEPSKSEINGKSEIKKIKRSPTMHKNIVDLPLSMVKSGFEAGIEEEGQTSSKVKIVVNEEDKTKENSPLAACNNLQEKIRNETPLVVDKKTPVLRRQKLSFFETFESHSKTFDEHSLLFPTTLGDDMARQAQSPQVYFTLGGEDKQPIPNLTIRERLQSSCKCPCSYTFTRVPSTLAELPEGVLRKIIQRNFPESSKNIKPNTNDLEVCYKCRRGYAGNNDNGKLLLETPTNATELLRGCNSSTGARVLRSNSLEALMEASCIIELPMPRSKKVPVQSKKNDIRAGFTKSLIGSTPNDNYSQTHQEDSGYAWGMVIQGFTKKNKNKGRRKTKNDEPKKKNEEDEEWWSQIQDGLQVEAKCPLIDQPVSEALCILGDLDNWQVGLLSNSSSGGVPMPVGMSRLVSNMLEAFAYMWKEYHSPEQCIKLIESRLREMWLRSETLAEFLLAVDLNDATIDNLTSFLDVDAADLPLLLAVATTHSPQIAQRFALTLA